jgi:hypothetical protein
VLLRPLRPKLDPGGTNRSTWLTIEKSKTYTKFITHHFGRGKLEAKHKKNEEKGL